MSFKSIDDYRRASYGVLGLAIKLYMIHAHVLTTSSSERCDRRVFEIAKSAFFQKRDSKHDNTVNSSLDLHKESPRLTEQIIAIGLSSTYS